MTPTSAHHARLQLEIEAPRFARAWRWMRDNFVPASVSSTPRSAVPIGLDWIQITSGVMNLRFGSADRPSWQRMTAAVMKLRGSGRRVQVAACDAPQVADLICWNDGAIEHKIWLVVDSEQVESFELERFTRRPQTRWRVSVRGEGMRTGHLLTLQKPRVILQRDTQEFVGTLVDLNPWEVKMDNHREEDVALTFRFEIGDFAFDTNEVALLTPGVTLKVTVPEALPALAICQGVPLYRGTLQHENEQLVFTIEEALEPD